ncbi:MAG TPA: ATP-binding protein [Polyangiales bacterium]
MSMFKKATKTQAKLRLAIAGPSGAGKTYTALCIGKHLGERIALIDTERGSASKYAGDVADFDTLELEHFAVQHYLKAIRGAAEEGYDVLVIDSLSHAWAGKGGILEEADKRGGKFGAWRELTPMQQSLMDAILSYPGHVICTMRSKMTYEVTTDETRGRKETKVEKIGLAPVQRDDVSYEFDLMLEMDERHTARVTKTRCSALADAFLTKPGKDVADALKAWLSDGAVAPVKPTVDEYGLKLPTVPCPVVRPGKPNAGRRWDDLPGGLIQKMHDENLDRMDADQKVWAVYLVQRRAARKAAEEAEALAAEQAAADAALGSAESGDLVDGGESGCGADGADEEVRREAV